MKKLISAAGLICFIVLFTAPVSKGAQWDNSYSFYNEYGNNAVFRGTSQTNGYIYCGTRGNCSEASVKYKNIGWKMSLCSLKGDKLQTIYFKLGGNYLTLADRRKVAGYEYDLYSISLYTLKQRMNQKVLKCLNKGECTIAMDACMVVVTDGKASGTINDSGIISGRVYTTYQGIVNAAQWSREGRVALNSYFGKPVNGLFLDVVTKKTVGIKKVSGSGKYCYGTYVTIEARAKSGYQFAKWKCGKEYKNIKQSFFINKSQTWTAYAVSKKLEVILYRNTDSRDTSCRRLNLIYPGKGEVLTPGSWNKYGYHLIGWSRNPMADSAIYPLGYRISSKWIAANSSPTRLYGVWKPNNYIVQYKGTLVQAVPRANVNYEDTLLLPENGDFLGWSLSPEALGSVRNNNAEADYYPQDQVSVKELVDKAGIGATDGGVITLYAIWDSIPVIEAEDLYYSLDLAKAGGITEQELSNRAQATDSHDGVIPYGRRENNSFYIQDYNDEIFTSLTQEGQIPISYIAINSAGKSVSRQIVVHIVDNSIMTERDMGRLRFINSRYFLDDMGDFVKEKAGGLIENSCWKKLTDYYSVLKSVLTD